MSRLKTNFEMLKQSEPNWCWLATTTSIYNFYLRREKLDATYPLIDTDKMFKLITNNSDYAAKYQKGGRDFPGKPKACLEAIDCFPKDGDKRVAWAKDLHKYELDEESQQAIAAHSGPSKDGTLSPAHQKLQNLLLDPKMQKSEVEKRYRALGRLRGQRAQLLRAMKDEILADRPVVCGYRAVIGGVGHALVMIGFERDTVVCKDPMNGDEMERRTKALTTMTTQSGKELCLSNVCFTQPPEETVVAGLNKYFSTLS